MAHGSNLLLNGISGKIGPLSVYTVNGKTHVRKRSAFVSSNSQRQCQYKDGVRAIAQAWSLTPLRARAAWGKLALRMPRWDAKTAQTPLTGYQAFQSVAWGLRVLEKPLPEFAPAVPDALHPLPDVNVAAARTGQTLLLTLGGGPYPDAVQVSACKPAMMNVACKNTWSQIAVLTQWDADTVDVGADYAALFGVPEDGAAVWLKLVAISPNGFRGQPLVVCAEVVESVPALALQAAPEPPASGLERRIFPQAPALPDANTALAP